MQSQHCLLKKKKSVSLSGARCTCNVRRGCSCSVLVGGTASGSSAS